MRTLTEHAKHELQVAGCLYDGADYHGSVISQVLDLISLFETSNDVFSTPLVIQLFSQLANREPLTPLTGNDDEWEQYADDLWVNKRYPNVRKGPDGVAYDTKGRLFRTPDGVCCTTENSKKVITFPYVPSPEYVDVDTTFVSLIKDPTCSI